MMSGMGDSFEEIPTKTILNGYLVCFVILNLLLIHVPILVALVSGDAIAVKQTWERFGFSYQNLLAGYNC
jgi:hypothetical protein